MRTQVSIIIRNSQATGVLPVVGPGLHATCPAAAATGPAAIRHVPDSVEAAAARVARAGRIPATTAAASTAGASGAAGATATDGRSSMSSPPAALAPESSPADDAYDTPWTDLAR